MTSVLSLVHTGVKVDGDKKVDGDILSPFIDFDASVDKP